MCLAFKSVFLEMSIGMMFFVGVFGSINSILTFLEENSADEKGFKILDNVNYYIFISMIILVLLVLLVMYRQIYDIGYLVVAGGVLVIMLLSYFLLVIVKKEVKNYKFKSKFIKYCILINSIFGVSVVSAVGLCFY